jgi:hypothetical protein
MNELFPIIRRKRRPLILENPETLKVETLNADHLPPVVSAQEKPKTNDAESISHDESE